MDLVFIVAFLLFSLGALYVGWKRNHFVWFLAGTLVFILFSGLFLIDGVTYQSGEVYTYNADQNVLTSMDYNYSAYLPANDRTMNVLNAILPALSIILVALNFWVIYNRIMIEWGNKNG